ncbi:MAG: tRNA (adenosine(37)-N6)-threonylcarbamoyltransferase complex dimerization subunit type 1 TsaB [Clostridia bacterium]|nr:tRNA (adenosine(37)-N6)-threonylcarbamoyltransferase complex dimerization subunit type 1 TsaB [Clostridia bacterium]MBR3862514.1 tRNA (adenosine(37)-N6)-threonylcarbamoyltransferase complex dimerization subunit type 1 TsaB [Clostridia bacterium]
MLIFALDSTAVVGSVALCRDDTPLASFTVKNGNTHSETLLPMAKALFDVTGYTPDDVDVFACSEGPGSFTGVRIGVATVKGLAFGKNKTVIGVSSLEAMARNLLPASGLICAVMNARRGQVYNALFQAKGNELTRLCPDRALAATDLEAELLARGEPFYLVGDGVEVTTAVFQSLTPLPVASIAAEQNALGVAACALRLYKEGMRTTDQELSPTYLRLPQAERERLEKEQAKKGSEQ